MIVRNRFGKFETPVVVGDTCRVVGYHTGDFIGDCEYVDREIARFRVVDPLRPAPKVSQKCPFPACVLREFHSADHELTSMRRGALIEVRWQFAKFEREREAA